MTILRKDTIIIVGTGSIGLATASNLAKLYSRGPSRPAIKVLDVITKPFAATSATCTGCFHYAFTDAALVRLGKCSFNLWAAEASADAEFTAATGYRSQSSFGIKRGSGKQLDKLPDWVQKDPSWDADSLVLGQQTATVNPIGVGEWLVKRCLDMGVQIITGLRAVGVSLSPQNRVQAVTCLTGEDHTPVRMGCRQLLLACGPWTPTVYQALFPSSPIALQWTTNAGDWILFRNPCPTSRGSVAFVSFASIAHGKLEFAGRNDGTIWCCGRRNLTASLPPAGQSQPPDEELVQELRSRAREWLNWSCTCTCEHKHDDPDDGFPRLMAKGRAFRPATQTGLPTISAVEASKLTTDAAAVDAHRQLTRLSSGVFVCWGHGSYGLTLGMGSGRLMSQLMHGDETDIDISAFSLEQ